MHGLIALATATGWVRGERDARLPGRPPGGRAAIAEHRPSLVFLCSPNNPTGTALELETIRAIHDAAPGIVVVDEAYAEFRRAGVPSAVTLLPAVPAAGRHPDHEQGFRAGRGPGRLPGRAPAVVDALQLVRLPYHLSALTQAAARVALAHSARAAGERRGAAGAARPAAGASCRALGLPGRPPATPTSCCSQVPGDQRPHLASPAGARGSGARRRAGRLAAGHRRHARRRWTRSCRSWSV